MSEIRELYKKKESIQKRLNWMSSNYRSGRYVKQRLESDGAYNELEKVQAEITNYFKNKNRKKKLSQ